MAHEFGHAAERGNHAGATRHLRLLDRQRAALVPQGWHTQDVEVAIEAHEFGARYRTGEADAV
ncbi:MAG: hypothetical protein CMJ85_05340 [Planctomycetes bacterium]|nr:hypothetical protein [Planctomycetota bacterium]